MKKTKQNKKSVKRYGSVGAYKKELERQQTPEYKRNRRRSMNLLKAKRITEKLKRDIAKVELYLDLARR